MRRFLAFCLIASLCLSAGTVRTQAPNDAPKKVDKAPADAKPGTLEQLQAEALRNNPDLRVSEAKLRLADAEFMRDRNRLLTQVAAAFAEVEATRGGAAEGMERLRTATQLFAAGRMSREEYGSAVLTYYKLNTDLVVVEARLQALLGRTGIQKSTPMPQPSPKK
jgi:outer membrane protein TolC